MADRGEYPDYEVEKFFEAIEPARHNACADPARQRIMSLLFEQPATTNPVLADGAHPTDQGHYGEVLREHPRPNNLLGAQLLLASAAGYFAEKVLELTKGFKVDPVPGERVYAFLGAVFLTNPNCPRKRARSGRWRNKVLPSRIAPRSSRCSGPTASRRWATRCSSWRCPGSSWRPPAAPPGRASPPRR